MFPNKSACVSVVIFRQYRVIVFDITEEDGLYINENGTVEKKVGKGPDI